MSRTSGDGESLASRALSDANALGSSFSAAVVVQSNFKAKAAQISRRSQAVPSTRRTAFGPVPRLAMANVDFCWFGVREYTHECAESTDVAIRSTGGTVNGGCGSLPVDPCGNLVCCCRTAGAVLLPVR
jgi:hypothetical protein